ncbi:MAG TPA: ATP-dependent DNA ligase [Candidatus Aquicultor sp.]|jgi:DNA ligase-1
MLYLLLAQAFRDIEATTKRIAMTDSLATLLRETPPQDIAKVVYLIQGRLHPNFMGIEIGMAEKLVVRAVANATGLSIDDVQNYLNESGDIGSTAQIELDKAFHGIEQPGLAARVEHGEALQPRGQAFTVADVYETLNEIATMSGPGSTERKIVALSVLLRRATPLEAKYIARTVTGKLRLGIADMTVLDALALVYGGGPASRPIIELTYNITSDLGLVAEALERGGVDALRAFTVQVGMPIRPMLAERLGTPADILARMGGECIAEYKYDGERVQVHKNGDTVLLFSRRLENITSQYPDIAEIIRSTITADTAILEGEIVAVDPETGENRPFQELMRRRRKRNIAGMAQELPASIFFFDSLFVDGRDLTGMPFLERRRELERIIMPSDRSRIVESTVVHSIDELEVFFEAAIEKGTEGIVCKAIGPESTYRAGSRGYLWIKYKREYRSEMTDTVDLVVVGAFYGRGKRAGVYGSLLMAVYLPETDTFRTVTRLGAGFTDKDLAELPRMLEPHKISHKNPRVDAKEHSDVWFVPEAVLEVIGAEITISPLHTAGLNIFRPGSGLAIRFPRFTGKYRFDKAPEDATTEQEVIEMYQSRIKKIAS